MKRTFPLCAVLSVTTGRRLTQSKGPHDNGIGDLCELLGHMTKDKPSIHQVPRFIRECKPWLYRWFPELQAVEVEVCEFCNVIKEVPLDNCDAPITVFLLSLGDRLGYHTLEVDQIPRDDHDVKDPYDELVAELGTDEGIILIDEGEYS